MLFRKKDLAGLILPLLLEQIIMGTIGMADMLMVASAGEAAVSGISLIDSINMLFQSMFSALATGGTIICTQYMGKGEPGQANFAAKHLLAFSAVFSIGIFVLCFLFRFQILNGLYGTAEEAVLREAMTYFYFSMTSYPFLMLLDCCSAAFRAMGNARLPFVVTFLMSMINIALNAVFIFGYGWGVFGAGLATMIARIVSSFALFGLLWKSRGVISARSFVGTGWEFDMVKNILRLALPTGLEDSIFHIGKLLVQGVVTSFGTAAIAANAVALTVSEFTHMPGYAIGLSLLTVVGRCAGAREYAQAEHYIKWIGALSLAITCLAAILSAIFAGPIAELYHLSAGTEDTAVALMRWQALACALVWVLAFNIPDALRAASDVRFTMTVSLLSMWIFRVGFSYIFRAFLDIGVVCVWFAMFLDWTFRASVFTWRLKSGKWKAKLFL